MAVLDWLWDSDPAIRWQVTTAGLRACHRRLRGVLRPGEAYLLERKIMRCGSSDEIVNPAWLQLSASGAPALRRTARPRVLPLHRGAPDARLGEDITLLRAMRQAAGCWRTRTRGGGALRARGRGRPSQLSEYAPGRSRAALARAIRRRADTVTSVPFPPNHFQPVRSINDG